MALVTPLLLVLLVGSVELGHYFYSEHKLVEAARDGARFAARQRFSNYTACTGSPPQTVIDDTKKMVRKGSLDNSATDLLPNWDAAGTTFSVTMTCVATLNAAGNSVAPSGIYEGMAGGAPAVSVDASLPYLPVIGGAFGFSGIGLRLNASQRAAVAGL
jgi:hypothetical protein